jgi:hypothetical protein
LVVLTLGTPCVPCLFSPPKEKRGLGGLTNLLLIFVLR